MHASSRENMQRCKARYVGPAFVDADEIDILDIGGADVNGGYRVIFDDPRFRYRTVDIEPGESVDIVLDDPYVLPLEDNSVDIVLSGQMLEHCEFFWLTFAEMVRVLKPTGLLILIAPSAGPIHRYPVDCYRFYPDAYHALAKWAGCHAVEVFHDERGPWNDLVGVFSKQPLDLPPPAPAEPVAAPIDVPRAADDEETTRGVASYLEVLRRLHDEIAPRLYLEIGVRHGRSLALATGPAIGVDPDPDVRVDLPPTTTVRSTTSDEFFATAVEDAMPEPVDLAFIDGMHLFEYALRDFMNVERRARPGGLIVIDDIFPCHPAQAERQRRTRHWTGDVWKLHTVLKENRPDLVLLSVDTHPTGLLLVAGADPTNRRLWASYNPIVRKYLEAMDPPRETLHREGSLDPSSPVLSEALALCADRSIPRPQLVARLRAVKKAAGLS